MKKKANKVDSSAVPEVQRYEQVKQEYAQFRAANPQFFEYLDGLQERYNSSRDAAEKAVRSLGVSCGDFDLYQFATTYDGAALWQMLGDERFAAVGGKTVTTTTFKVEGAVFDAAVLGGQLKDVPQDKLDSVRKVTPRYKTPPKMEVL